ncbi:MAG: hypothetical protein JSR34_04535 [Proteobacteria bacterium]|nr:hypothetical protein [Pseudomonadota bacterium]
MAKERLLHCVGITDEDSAHLRLLLRAAKKDLKDGWSWGPEGKADVVIVDARRLLGESAKRRAQQRDVPCADVIGPRERQPSGPFLRRPFKREAVVVLLNGISDGNVMTVESAATAWGDDDIEFDMGTIDLSALEDRYPGRQDAGAHRIDPEQATAAAKSASAELAFDLSQLPNPDAADEGAITATHCTDHSSVPAAAPPAGSDSSGSTEEAFEAIDPKATYAFLDFFERRLLRVPSRLTLPGTPALDVDPRTGMFLTQGSLAAMEPYARKRWRYADWQPLSPAEAAAMERSSFTKPWAALVWMYHFIHSKGMLSRKFNATGEFRLLNRFNVAVEYPQVHRVGAQLAVPRKLHEVARMSRVDIDLVFDVINAYDSVGYVEGPLRN